MADLMKGLRCVRMLLTLEWVSSVRERRPSKRREGTKGGRRGAERETCCVGWRTGNPTAEQRDVACDKVVSMTPPLDATKRSWLDASRYRWKGST